MSSPGSDGPGNDQPLRRSLALCALSVGGYLLYFGLNVVLARTLAIGDFDDYNVAVSTVLILSTLATFGLEKLALKYIPAYRERGDWDRCRGFVRFSLRWMIAASAVLVVLLAAGVQSARILSRADHHLGIVFVVAVLPIVTCFLFLLEVATAYGAPLRAVTIYRILLPAILIALNLGVIVLPIDSTAITAAACYGIGWSMAMASVAILIRRVAPRELESAGIVVEWRKWLGRSLPLLAFSLLMTIHGQSGVIVLEFLYPSEPVVSQFAVAMYTGNFVVLIATATNRFYLPQLAVILERRDTAALRAVSRQRTTLVGALVAGYLAVVLLAGRQILGAFGPDFPAAYPALCVIAVGASISTILSLAPYLLHFAGQNRLAVAWTAGTAVLSVTSSVWLGSIYGALGTAVGYTGSLTLLFVGLAMRGGATFTAQR